jgi:uncharacterized protein (TIGR02246 family)
MPASAICCTLLVGLAVSTASPVPAHVEHCRGATGTAGQHDAGRATSQSQAAAPSRADETAVRDLVSRYNAARDRQDAAALASLLTENADQLVSSGEWRKGRTALVRGMQQSSAANPGGRTITVDAVRFLGPDVALLDARYEIAASGGADPRRMWSAFVMVRTPDGSRIEAIRNMLPAR